MPEPSSNIRVWAETVDASTLIITWDSRDASKHHDHAAETHAVAAALSVLSGVSAVTAVDNGVRVVLDTNPADRTILAATTRAALSGDDLRTRATALTKRIPTYATLARSLALDARISPLPEVTRQAALRRATPMRMIPGLQIVTQIATFAPMLASISTWSRDASPEVVAEHLQHAGLTQEIIDADLATAREATALAKSVTADTAMKVASRAGKLAGRARNATEQWIERRNQKTDAEE